MAYPICSRCGLDMMGTGYSCDCLPEGVEPGRFNPYRPEPTPKQRRTAAPPATAGGQSGAGDE